jgi:two-component system CheB/CheR fusion protein
MRRTRNEHEPGSNARATRSETRSAASAGHRRAEQGRAKAQDFPIVAIGASAGGLDAYKRFLAAMPAKSGMAFVLIPHLDPRHESMMAELLAKQTAMPVHEAAQGMRLAKNHVYIIPPNKYLAVKHGQLELSAPSPSLRETAIDFALCSLAADQREAAIGIIFSGTGSFGTLGVKEIKLAGGLVLAQDPATAEYDSMPRSAIAAGVVDHVLPPEKLPEALLRYLPHWQPTGKRAKEPEHGELEALRRVLAVLQTRGKLDFQRYRKNMIVRRIERRMALLHVGGWDAYVERLRNDHDEVMALRGDLLIGVTTFFRDPDAFEALATHALPQLIERANADVPLRVWSPGCASGEEAYSIAMLLIEQFAAVNKAPTFQLFATDVDERALEVARAGVYPKSIATVLTPERLKRFFVNVDRRQYQVSKQLRDSIVFAQQNLIADAPFSKLDLISCRNVLIYLEPQVQEAIVSLLHFALNDGGYLLLGPSESIGRGAAIFEPVSKKWRLYRRIGPTRRDLATFPIAAHGERLRPLQPDAARRAPRFAQLLQKVLVEDFAPASVLIGRDYEILSVQGPLVDYLEFPAGDMTKNLLVLARQGLRAKIRAACQKALLERRPAIEPGARVRRNGDYVSCTVSARPITQSSEAEGLLLVAFQDHPERAPAQSAATVEHATESSMVEQLENELRATREDLRSTIEELESSNEELKTSNEEIMSMNEELQSTNEELETSKEELQSLNEELATVNSQLQDKVEDLDTTNNDLANLINVTGIPTVFLDRQLKIKRFTPPTSRLLNLMTGDVGRPFHDFASRLKDDDLLADAERVLATQAPAEKVVQTDENQWYLRRILPYRTADGGIRGVVITFVDITERMQAEGQARRLAHALYDSNDAVIVTDLKGRVISWNRGAERYYGYTEADAFKMNIADLLPEGYKQTAAEIAARAARGEPIAAFEARRVTRDGRPLDMWVTITVLKDDNGRPAGVVRTERDVTLRRQAEEEIRKLNTVLEQRVAERTAALETSEARTRSVLDAAVDAIITINAEGAILTFNAAAEKMFGYSAQEAIGRNVKVLMGPPYRDRHDEYLRRYRQTGEQHVIGTSRELRGRRKDGTGFPMQLSVKEVAGHDVFTGVIRDLTEQRALQEEIVRIATLEQRRIGQELHDSTQQELSGLGMLAQNLSEALGANAPSVESALAAQLAAGIAKVNLDLRSLARGLVPVPIPHGLMAGLDELAKSTEQTHGVACRFECPAPVELEDDGAATQLYRIAQEAVTNALKHAEANAVTIRLERSADALELEVSDDGVGIEERREPQSGLGLRIMKHRCSIIGGELEVRRRAVRGTAVICRLPDAVGIRRE